MATFQINVKNAHAAIPFPNNASIGDLAHVYFPAKNGTQLMHKYHYTMKGWQYIGFSVIYDK